MAKNQKTSHLNVSYLYSSVFKFNPVLDDLGFGSDAIVIDLEDGVHDSAKEQARQKIASLDISDITRKDLMIGVRINQVFSIEGIRDLAAVYSAVKAGSLAIDFLKIPKVRTYHDVLLCKKLFDKLPIEIKMIPIIEVPEAIDNIDQIAALSDAMMFGQVDMAATMYHLNKSYMDYARGKFCIACAQKEIAAIDTAAIRHDMDLKDMRAFEKECLASKDEGFTGKAIIHPDQVPIVNKVYSVTEQEMDGYRSVVNLYENADIGFSIVEGKIIAPPFVARAQMMLRLYGHR